METSTKGLQVFLPVDWPCVALPVVRGWTQVMKTPLPGSRGGTRFLNCLILLFILHAGSHLYAARTNDEFSAVGRAVVALLQSRDADRFARELTPDLEDYRAALSTNLPTTGG